MIKRYDAAAKLLLLVLGAAVAVAGAEVTLRLRGYQAFSWSNRVNPQILELTDDPELPYVLMPGAEGRGWDTEIRVNTGGFRDREFKEDKGRHYRIAAIGDSITFGSGISQPTRLYPKILERLIRSRAPDLRAEVLNFGVTGYDVVNNVEHLRVRGMKFHPDVVVMAFCVNDIGTASTAIDYVKAERYLSNPVFRSRTAQWVLSTALRLKAARTANRLGETDAFATANRERILPIAGDAQLVKLSARLAQLSHGGDDRVLLRWWGEPSRLGYLEYAFDQMKSLQQEGGFKVIVVAVPLLSNDDIAGWRIVNQIIRHESLKFGFQFVNVAGQFARAGRVRLRNTPSDAIHPSPEGHAIIAQAVYRSLAASRLPRR